MISELGLSRVYLIGLPYDVMSKLAGCVGLTYRIVDRV